MVGTHISYHKPAKTVHMYITLHLRQKQGQNAIAHAYGRVCRWWDTYIIPQACQDSPHVYYASSTAKTKTKRHCACVWTCLQMVGHIYHTTSLPRQSTCILRFIYGKNKDKTPLRMRMDGLVDGGTHISYHKPAKTVHMYIIRFIYGKNKDKTPLRMRMDGLVDGGTHISYHKPAKTVRIYIK